MTEKVKIVGCDVGTGTLLTASMTEENKIKINRMRDMFIFVDDDDITSSELSESKLDYITQYDDEGNVEFHAVIGNDALIFSNLFDREVKRPMSNGVISSTEIDAIDIITKMFEKLTGVVEKDQSGLCVYSIPAPAVDIDMPSVDYHEHVFKSIFNSLNFEAISLNEGHSVIFSECAKEKFTGIGISFGAGLTNVCLSYKGSAVLKFSVGRGGDWIDKNAGKSVNKVPNKMTSIKEKSLDLSNPSKGDKKQKREREAIAFYYEMLIEHVLKTFINEFNNKTDGTEFEEAIPIVLSGGTSLVKGFKDTFEKKFKELGEFPYEVSTIKMAKDPISTVAQGCLIYAHWLNKKSQGTNSKPETNKNEKQ